jgi:hypothetical protein
MAGRVIGAVALEMAITIVLSLLLIGGLLTLFGEPALEAFFDQGPRLLVAGMGIGLIAWIVMLVIGMIRNRSRAGGWRVGTSIVSAIAALIVNLIGVSIIGFTGGGWSVFIIVFAVEAGAAFLVAAIASALIVHLGVFKRKPQRESAVPS